MKTNVSCLKAAVMLGLVGAAAGVAHAQPATPYPVNIGGSSLFEFFFAAPQSTFDAIDADGDGHARLIFTKPDSSVTDGSVEQLAPLNVQPTLPWWAVQYRSLGSGNGLAELVNWGTRFAEHTYNTGVAPYAAGELTYPPDNAYCNRVKYYDGGGTGQQATFNIGNPGGLPYREDETSFLGSFAGPGTAATGGVRIDAAIMDVPTTWFITQSGTASPTATPVTGGYGNFSKPAKNVNGTNSAQGNKLKSLTSTDGLVQLNLNTATPNSLTVFDTPIASAPIAYMVNYGTGKQQMTYTQLRHLFVTGRLPSGENLTAITRDSGSGTRNGAANAMGIDPSWAAGENVGVKNDDAAGIPSSDRSIVGPNFIPSNKGGSGSMERTVKNVRLGIGMTGAERGIANTWLLNHNTELLGVKNDVGGGTVYARPTIQALLHNDLNGYNIAGPETIATIGDPRAAAPADGGTGWAGAFPSESGQVNTNPAMRNHYAAQYINNITRSITAFVDFTEGQANFTPGEYLADNFILVAATDNVPDPLHPTTLVANPTLNSNIQTQLLTGQGAQVFGRSEYTAFNDNFAGVVPTRMTLSTGTYTDGSTSLYVMNGQGGTDTITAGTADIPHRNKVQGDFNGDGVRDINDIADMIGAWRRYNTAGTWNAPDGIYGAGAGATLSIDLVGDFNSDGKFDASDVRYFADGLAIAVSGPHAGQVDRKAAFTQVDTSFGGNFFGVHAYSTGQPYHAGDARGDIAGAAGTTPGYSPVGADGFINAADIDYVYKQFKQNTVTGGGPVHWNVLAEAASADLSADINGDLVIDQNDVIELVQNILGTSMGDVNLDGHVDATDLAIAQAHLGQSGGWAIGDVDGDGVVTAADIAIIQSFLPHCGSADFNCDGDIGTDLDIEAFFACLAGSCPPAPCTSTADFNADGDIGTDADIEAFFRVLAGGNC
jgi:hypothetical protein